MDSFIIIRCRVSVARVKKHLLLFSCGLCPFKAVQRACTTSSLSLLVFVCCEIEIDGDIAAALFGLAPSDAW